MPTFVGMTNQEMACRDASFRRKPESSAGERRSTGCAEQLQNTKQIALSSYQVLSEVVAHGCFLLLLARQVCEVLFKPGAEVDVPAPEPSQKGFGVLIVPGSEFTVGAVISHHGLHEPSAKSAFALGSAQWQVGCG
jgi:hypothetical protein